MKLKLTALLLTVAAALPAVNNDLIRWSDSDRQKIQELSQKIQPGNPLKTANKFCDITVYGGTPEFTAQIAYYLESTYRQYPNILNVTNVFGDKTEVNVYQSHQQYVSESKAPANTAGVCAYRRNKANVGWIPTVSVYHNSNCDFLEMREVLTHEVTHAMTRQLILQKGVETPSLGLNEGLSEFFRHWDFCSEVNPRGQTDQAKEQRRMRRLRSHLPEKILLYRRNSAKMPTAEEIMSWQTYESTFSYEMSEAFVDFLFSEPQASYLFGAWISAVRGNKQVVLRKKQTEDLEKAWQDYLQKTQATKLPEHLK